MSMKRRCLLKMSTLWLVLALFSSCEDDGNKPEYNFRMYGLPLELSSGVIWHGNNYKFFSREDYVFKDTYVNEQGQEVTDEIKGFRAGKEQFETGNFIVSLYGPELRFNGELQTTVGKDACLCLHMASEDLMLLKPGKYVFNTERQKFTFTAWVSSGFDMAGSNVIATISKGEVNVEKLGNGYRIGFHCETDFGGTVSGVYNGPLSDCEVFRESMSYSQDVKLSGILSRVEYIYESWWGGELKRDTGLDISVSKAFLIAATGGVRVADNTDKERIDIALVYDESNNELVFEAPVRMRKYTGHNPQYDCPCYTIYCKAPDTFTDEDFDRLKEEDFNFTVEEQKVSFSLDHFSPGYVFFLTGSGLKGVIKVKDFTPYDPKGTYVGWSWDDEYDIYGPASPALIMDIRCPGGASYSQIM